MKIGILALQGDVAKHQQLLDELGLKAVPVRYPAQLDGVEGLILPGGESTTMNHLMGMIGFHDPLREFARSYPLLGTCAGLIMMARKVSDPRIQPLGLLKVTVQRNAYGRQVDSFCEDLPVHLNGQARSIRATFIRAPRISSLETGVEILSTYQDDPVAVRQGRHIGLAFHPELNRVTLFHEQAFVSAAKTGPPHAA